MWLLRERWCVAISKYLYQTYSRNFYHVCFFLILIKQNSKEGRAWYVHHAFVNEIITRLSRDKRSTIDSECDAFFVLVTLLSYWLSRSSIKVVVKILTRDKHKLFSGHTRVYIRVKSCSPCFYKCVYVTYSIRKTLVKNKIKLDI